MTADIAAKAAAGYNVTIVDPYGRLLSYQLLYGTDGGVMDTLSGLTSLSNFTSYNVPYPILTTTTDFPEKGVCYPSITGPIFEFRKPDLPLRFDLLTITDHPQIHTNMVLGTEV